MTVLLAAAREIVNSDAMGAIVKPDAAFETIYKVGRWVEGPAYDCRRGALMFSDVKVNCILRMNESRRSIA